MSALNRTLVHLSYYPTLWLNTVMCWLGVWRRWDWIDPHVLVGMMPRPKDLTALKALGVGSVVNMCEEFAGDVDELAKLGLTQLHLPTLDYHCPSEEHLRLGVAFIGERIALGEKVYLHCKAGRGRSATMAVCYLMVARGLTAKQAYAALKAGRPHVDRGIVKRDAVLRLEDSPSQFEPSQS
jgi:atypical dual specificity phosphatase